MIPGIDTLIKYITYLLNNMYINVGLVVVDLMNKIVLI